MAQKIVKNVHNFDDLLPKKNKNYDPKNEPRKACKDSKRGSYQVLCKVEKISLIISNVERVKFLKNLL